MAGVATRRDSARSRSGPVRHWRRRVCRSSVLSRRMGRSGDCVREEYCDEVAYIEGITCPWSDRRIRRTGAPHVEECPSADSGHPSAAALAEMVRGPIRSRSRSMRTATRWRASDWRGLGICGANSDVVCTPSRSADEVCFNFLESPGLGAFGGSPARASCSRTRTCRSGVGRHWRRAASLPGAASRSGAMRRRRTESLFERARAPERRVGHRPKMRWLTPVAGPYVRAGATAARPRGLERARLRACGGRVLRHRGAATGGERRSKTTG